jgi:hypothetical protein
VILEHRIYENDDRAGLLVGHRREGAVDLAGATRPQELKPHAQGPGGILRVSHLRRVAWVGWIMEDGHPRDLGDDRLEDL